MKDIKLGIVGLGYVGLPLAVEFSKKYHVVGFDINLDRIAELKKNMDHTLEVETEVLKKSNVNYTSSVDDLKGCNVYIITVPTPVNEFKQPDLTPLYGASNTIGKVLKKNDIVIYESTVYPGCTEEECVPVLEKVSGLKFNKDFFCGYSPERMNPGDKERTVTKIVKVTSGSTPEVANIVNDLYGSIVTAGTHKASSIKVAEASKVIENTQRDINIAFINELAIIFNKLGIDTKEVLDAAGTKWNFIKFQPGLVGGHCIGVDPYYLTHKAEALGYHPDVILSGRRINDGMGAYIANQVVKLMIKKGHTIDGAKVLIMGLTFKENCPDIRNTKVVDVVEELKEFGCVVDIYDPWANAKEVEHEYKLTLSASENIANFEKYSAVIFAVAHKQFKEMQINKANYPKTVIYDLKSMFRADSVDARL